MHSLQAGPIHFAPRTTPLFAMWLSPLYFFNVSNDLRCTLVIFCALQVDRNIRIVRQMNSQNILMLNGMRRTDKLKIRKTGSANYESNGFSETTFVVAKSMGPPFFSNSTEPQPNRFF